MSDALNGNKLVLGKGAQSSANESSAIGAGAKVLSGADSSVALGDNSEADRLNEVSIGYKEIEGVSAQYTRLLSNLKAGELDTDAVNLKQMRDAIAASQPVVLYSGSVISPKEIQFSENVSNFRYVEFLFREENIADKGLISAIWSKEYEDQLTSEGFGGMKKEVFAYSVTKPSNQLEWNFVGVSWIISDDGLSAKQNSAFDTSTGAKATTTDRTPLFLWRVVGHERINNG